MPEEQNASSLRSEKLNKMRAQHVFFPASLFAGGKNIMSRLRPMLSATLVALLLGSAGCRVDTHKNAEGKDNVDIGTPFGSMHVKTDDKASGANTGLTPYPGATVVKKDNDENGAADISMNFAGFSLGVHAVDLRTTDPEDKVLAFYKKDMARYGDVLTCKGKTAVGTPTRTNEGLTCGSDRNHINVHDGDHMELRAGSDRHQHIVGVHTEDGATRIGLVALDLPGEFSHHHEETDRE